MCIICIDIEKNILSPLEARRNLGEMSFSLDLDHIKEVQEKIYDLIDAQIRGYDETEEEFCETCGCESCECDWRHY